MDCERVRGWSERRSVSVCVVKAWDGMECDCERGMEYNGVRAWDGVQWSASVLWSVMKYECAMACVRCCAMKCERAMECERAMLVQR